MTQGEDPIVFFHSVFGFVLFFISVKYSVQPWCKECYTLEVLLACLIPSKPSSRRSNLFPIITLECFLSALEDLHSWVYSKHSQLTQEK